MNSQIDRYQMVKYKSHHPCYNDYPYIVKKNITKHIEYYLSVINSIN